mmetsp:Transcript_24051/g.42450  ORF Transcript_24051/g.42450 Transcript_24051/m.42450 type:complete len:102 (+) Transcript_24051:489-794(+)
MELKDYEHGAGDEHRSGQNYLKLSRAAQFTFGNVVQRVKGQGDANHVQAPQAEVNEEKEKVAMIVKPDAVVHPRAMVVETQNAFVACRTVPRSRWLWCVTF